MLRCLILTVLAGLTLVAGCRYSEEDETFAETASAERTAPAEGDHPMVDPVPPDSIPPAPVRSPEEARVDLKVEDGFEVEIVAAEPDVIDPVALAFDGNGAMWVVEMRGYMTTTEGDAEVPVGRIRVLRDTDGDGRYETSRTFLKGLNMPRAVLPLERGVLVAEPPRLYFVERAGDGYTAGAKTVVDSAYAVDGNPEHLPNGLLWARDNWIYSAKSDVRYRYAGGQWERDSTEFRGQWGITQDDYGRLFYNHNSATLLGDDFLPNTFPNNPHHERRGDLPYGEQKVSNRVYPRRMTPGVNRGYRPGVLDEEGKLVTVTSAAGPTIYRGDQFPERYYGNAFVAEPAAHLVKRVVLTDSSGEVKGALPYTGREFLTATDERFRPTNLHTAPDGSLFLVDMYRGIIQHETYLTEYLRRQIERRDLDVPVGLGRIYRVRHAGRPLGEQPRMREAASVQLVKHLTHPNGWWRDTAQRLLVERGDRSVVPTLRRLATNDSQRVSQIHALWTLDGLGALTLRVLRRAASTQHAKVRAAVVRLARKRAPDHAALALLERLYETSSPEVDLRVALALPAFRTQHPERVDAMLAHLAAAYGDQPTFQDAILSGLEDREKAFADDLQQRGVSVAPGFSEALAAAHINAQMKPVARTDVLTAAEIATLEEGRTLYAGACASCHGTGGRGIENLGPPLVRSQWALQEPETLTRIVLDGLHGPVSVDGVTYAQAAQMPGHRRAERLTNDKLAKLLTFVRNAWSNRAPAVSAQEIGRVRQATKSHAGQTYSADQLERIEAQNPDWTPLLDGESLDGWQKLGGEATYTVEDGVLVGTAVPGTPNTFLATERHYGDFVLELDFKVDSLLNSGVQIRSNSYAGYRDGRVHGYQVEIDPSERAWTGGLYDEARRGWLFPLDGHRAAQRAFRQGAWNHFRIEARGPHLRTWINGVLAADLIDTRTASGFIALQVHSVGSDERLAGRHVRWKNIRIKDLSTSTIAASLDPVATPITAATDGDSSTYWQAEGDRTWIQVDLRKRRRVEGVAVDFHAGERRTYRFAVALSIDGASWREVFRGTSRGAQTTERFTFPAQEARYVRITGYGNNRNDKNAYTEIEVITP